jgi:hypothetical protein
MQALFFCCCGVPCEGVGVGAMWQPPVPFDVYLP